MQLNQCLVRIQLEIAVADSRAALCENQQVAHVQHTDDFTIFCDQLGAHKAQLDLFERELQSHLTECDECKDGVN